MGRTAAVLALVAALIAWFEIASHLSEWTLWPTILLIAVVLIPATFLLVWLALPLWQWRWLLPAGAGFILLGLLLSAAGLPVGSNFCKLAALTFIGWWFLRFFEELSWVVIVALLIPWVDAYSVWRGPTKQITEDHEEVFGALSIAFVVPGGGSARLGLPDVLFFAVFLAASVRFGLRPFATWVGLTASLSLTMICATWWDVSGLPALPGLSLGFLIPNADLLWRRLRPSRAESRPDGRSVSRPLEQRHRLDVRRVREHVDRGRADETVAVVLGETLRVAGERGRVARDVDDARRCRARRDA